MKRKIITDIFLNIIATFIPMFTLQFLILPYVASKIGADSYGQLLTVITLVNLSASTFGGVLNNSRLINFRKYDELKIQGDFNIILIIFVAVNVFVVSLGLIYYGRSLEIMEIVVLVVSSLLMLLNIYGSVEFRIKLNFKYILLNSVMMLVGYLVGFVVFLLTKNWLFIYFLGFAFNNFFIVKKTNIFKEPLKKTLLFKTIFSKTLLLLASGILVSLGAYVDKLLIFPLLGGSAVTIYYTATILGKTIALAIEPITGVLLSYFAHMKKFSSSNFGVLMVISAIVGTISYFGIIFLSKPVLNFLYPQYAEESLKYIYITTLSIIITITCNIVNSVLLKFCNVKWQIYINGIYMLVYISLSITFLMMYGLIGFCIGMLIAISIKLVLMIIAYYNNSES